MSQFGKHASFLWRVTDVNYGPLHNHLRRKLWRDCKYSRKVLRRLWTRKYKCWHSTSCKDGSVMYRKLKLIFDQVQRWRAVSRKPTFCGCVHRRIGLDRTARLSSRRSDYVKVDTGHKRHTGCGSAWGSDWRKIARHSGRLWWMCRSEAGVTM